MILFFKFFLVIFVIQNQTLRLCIFILLQLLLQILTRGGGGNKISPSHQFSNTPLRIVFTQATTAHSSIALIGTGIHLKETGSPVKVTGANPKDTRLFRAVTRHHVQETGINSKETSFFPSVTRHPIQETSAYLKVTGLFTSITYYRAPITGANQKVTGFFLSVTGHPTLIKLTKTTFLFIHH